jgi:hypothetical protein
MIIPLYHIISFNNILFNVDDFIMIILIIYLFNKYFVLS